MELLLWMLWQDDDGVVMNPVVLVLTMSVGLCSMWMLVVDGEGVEFGVLVGEEEEELENELFDEEALTVL